MSGALAAIALLAVAVVSPNDNAAAANITHPNKLIPERKFPVRLFN